MPVVAKGHHVSHPKKTAFTPQPHLSQRGDIVAAKIHLSTCNRIQAPSRSQRTPAAHDGGSRDVTSNNTNQTPTLDFAHPHLTSPDLPRCINERIPQRFEVDTAIMTRAQQTVSIGLLAASVACLLEHGYTAAADRVADIHGRISQPPTSASCYQRPNRSSRTSHPSNVAAHRTEQFESFLSGLSCRSAHIYCSSWAMGSLPSTMFRRHTTSS